MKNTQHSQACTQITTLLYNETMTNIAKPEAATMWESVHRIVFPTSDQELTFPLYAQLWRPSHIPPEAFDFQQVIRHKPVHPQESAADTFASGSVHVRSRYSATLYSDTHITFCTYFNAFPASYWRYWTGVRAVRFSMQARGSATVQLFKSDSLGLSTPVGTLTFSSHKDDSEILTITIPLTGTIDGGFIWFDIKTNGDDFELHEASWQVDAAAKRHADELSRFSIAITTFNREAFALRQLKSIADDPLLRERLDTVYCIDQGTHPLSALKDFDRVKRELGDQLTYIRQANLGGSGGFSRGMYETEKAGTSSSVVLLDDDAINEPEALLRAVQFADYTYKPSLVGAGMLHLDNRSMLYTQGERVNTRTLLPEQYAKNHDFAVHSLANSPELHRRMDSEYNAWWMCLIPVDVMKKIGYAMPVSIKYDDVEYGYRARANGFPTISLPGVALWHQAWHSKDSSRSWQEYFEARNRILFALLTYERPWKSLTKVMLAHEASLGLRFLYSGISMNNLAMKEILSGPETIVSHYPHAIADVNKYRSQFDDAHVLNDEERARLPLPTQSFYDKNALYLSESEATRQGMKATVRALLTPRRATPEQAPQLSLTAQEANWQTLEPVTSALVASSDGNSISLNRRDDFVMRKGVWEGFRLTRQIIKHWGSLRHRYLSFGFASRNMWEKIFSQADQEAKDK